MVKGLSFRLPLHVNLEGKDPNQDNLALKRYKRYPFDFSLKSSSL